MNTDQKKKTFIKVVMASMLFFFLSNTLLDSHTAEGIDTWWLPSFSQSRAAVGSLDMKVFIKGHPQYIVVPGKREHSTH